MQVGGVWGGLERQGWELLCPVCAAFGWAVCLLLLPQLSADAASPARPPAAEGMSEGEGEEEEEEEGGRDGDAMDEGEPTAKRQRGAAAAQNAQLFAEAGQFNPHAARAERKARKKGAALRQAWAEVDAEAGPAAVAGGEDYDFEADWSKGGEGSANPFAKLEDGGDSGDE